jgi:hypothetical protein
MNLSPCALCANRIAHLHIPTNTPISVEDEYEDYWFDRPEWDEDGGSE